MVEWLGKRAGTRQVMPDAKPGNDEWIIRVRYESGEIRTWMTDELYKVRIPFLFEWKLGNVVSITISEGAE